MLNTEPQGLMMNLLKSFTGIFTIEEPRIQAALDPTDYCIETIDHKYNGKIIYQDDVVINFKVPQSKFVKILKKNIRRITIHHEENGQDFQWNRPTRLQA